MMNETESTGTKCEGADFKVVWSASMKLGDRKESEALPIGPALSLAKVKSTENRFVALLKRGTPPNTDKFFLDRFIKP